MFENKKIFVFGLARSGYEVSKLLSNYNNEILICDKSDEDQDKIKELEKLNIKFIKTDKPEDFLDATFNYVIKNPGIINTHSCIIKAKLLNIPVINEMEVGYNFIKNKATIIGITGSNGKTTTTTLIYEVMKKAGLPVILAGNIGYPLCQIVNKVKDNDIIIMEVSDHQLVNVDKFKTNISVLTNLSEVHIDFHGTYEKYKEAKKKIFNHQTSEDISIINIGNKDVVEISKEINSKIITFSSSVPANYSLKENYITYNDNKVLDLNNVKIKGLHNYENIMCMLAIAKIYNIPISIIEKYLKTFNGVEHRIEYVKTINNRLFYNDSKATNTESTIVALKSFDNDSKATNTESTIVALKSFDNDIILLMGGLDRGHSFEPLNEYLANVTNIFCYGETKDRIYNWATKQNIHCEKFDNLKEATLKAYEVSKENDIILLSPACASWDQYKCMEDRGNEFKSIINNINN